MGTATEEPGALKRISEVRKLTGGRYLVCLEDGLSFPLYARELEAFAVTPDAALTAEDLHTILEELLPRRARLCAMHLLKSMDRTEWQLRRKLRELEYPQQIMEDAVAYVKQYRYIDDLRYAVAYMEYRKDSRSLKRMEQELYRRGISREVFRQALEQMEQPDEEAQVRRWMEKRHYDPAGADRKEQEKMCRFLLGKGYRLSLIRRLLGGDSLYE